MFDGVDARLGGKEDALRAVRVRRDFAAQTVRVRNQGLQFFEAILAGLGIVAFRQHSAGGANLDQIDAVFNVLAQVLLYRRDTVGNTFGAGMIFRREEVSVAVPAGDTQRRSAHLHMRTWNVTRVDIVAQGDVRVTPSADI